MTAPIDLLTRLKAKLEKIQQWTLGADSEYLRQHFAVSFALLTDLAEAVRQDHQEKENALSRFRAATAAPVSLQHAEALTSGVRAAEQLADARQLIVEVYEDAKNHYGAQCFDFTCAPPSMQRDAQKTAREGFDAICKKLGTIALPILKAVPALPSDTETPR